MQEAIPTELDELIIAHTINGFPYSIKTACSFLDHNPCC